jgi:signal transduction histidine kinase/CheY-like chemotaxis protein
LRSNGARHDPLDHLRPIETEEDVVAARQRARHVAALLGFEQQDQTRIATAVSEIARNAYTYAGGGRVEFALDETGRPQSLVVRVSDQGPGIANLGDILAGQYRSHSGMGLGILGARRLLDEFDVATGQDQGTTVTLRKTLPPRAPALAPEDVSKLADSLAKEKPRGSLAELREQNRELMGSLEEVRKRQEELSRLNRELADTNRGVVALYAELDERAEQLKRANEIKTRFLSNMTHEFRTPLNAIMALTGLLLDRSDGPLTPEQELQVTYIRQSATALSDIVNDLLDIAKVEAGKTTVSASRFHVDDLFGALRGMLRPLCVDDGVSLVFERDEGLPSIYGDERKVSQVLRNFVSNALKFTTRGEVTVSASLADGENIVFTVRDTGIGIAPEHHAAIFEEFTQIENALQGRAKGTGLGLALSKSLAELMGGRVWVESALGAGAAFYLQIPLEYRAADGAPQPTATERPRAGLHRVLIVDDDEMARYTLRRLLDGVATVSEAPDGLTGLHAAAVEHPDAIMLDLRMPGLSGFEVLERLGADAATRDIPVVVVTSALLHDSDQAKLRRAATILPKERLSRQSLIETLTPLFARAEVSHAAK